VATSSTWVDEDGYASMLVLICPESRTRNQFRMLYVEHLLPIPVLTVCRQTTLRSWVIRPTERSVTTPTIHIETNSATLIYLSMIFTTVSPINVHNPVNLSSAYALITMAFVLTRSNEWPSMTWRARQSGERTRCGKR
jgi:hypothetical protein